MDMLGSMIPYEPFNYKPLSPYSTHNFFEFNQGIHGKEYFDPSVDGLVLRRATEDSDYMEGF